MFCSSQRSARREDLITAICNCSYGGDRTPNRLVCFSMLPRHACQGLAQGIRQQHQPLAWRVVESRLGYKRSLEYEQRTDRHRAIEFPAITTASETQASPTLLTTVGLRRLAASPRLQNPLAVTHPHIANAIGATLCQRDADLATIAEHELQPGFERSGGFSTAQVQTTIGRQQQFAPRRKRQFHTDRPTSNANTARSHALTFSIEAQCATPLLDTPIPESELADGDRLARIGQHDLGQALLQLGGHRLLGSNSTSKHKNTEHTTP